MLNKRSKNSSFTCLYDCEVLILDLGARSHSVERLCLTTISSCSHSPVRSQRKIRASYVFLPCCVFCAIVHQVELGVGMAFLVRLLGLTVLSVGSLFVPMTLLICNGTLNWLIPVSQGASRFFVLAMLLLLPPLFFLFLASAALRRIKTFSFTGHPIGLSR